MLSAVIVDDEKKSIKNLEFLLEQNCKEVQVVNTAGNALEAVKIILQVRPDIIFLDVQMPGYTGFDVLDQLADIESKVIFTTAHKDYAIQALRKGAFDYLLKPIDADDLKACIERIIEKTTKKTESYPATIELAVKSGIIFIKPQEIIRLEASGSYTVLYLDNQVKHVASKSMKEYEKLLDPALFYRCHNSHIINLSKVIRFINKDGYYVQMSDESTPEIARKNKDSLLMKLKGNG